MFVRKKGACFPCVDVVLWQPRTLAGSQTGAKARKVSSSYITERASDKSDFSLVPSPPPLPVF